MVFNTSRSVCIPPRLSQLPAHHGEKSRTTSPVEMLNFGVTDTDISSLLCVNPYEVNPLIGPQIYLHRNTVDTNNYLKQKEDDSRITIRPYATTSKNLKVEMEVFKDLTPFLPRTAIRCTPNVADELNTPVLDRKEGFDFTQYACVSTQPSESSFNFKIKNEQSELNAINVNNNEYSLVFKGDHTNNNNNTNIASAHESETVDNRIFITYSQNRDDSSMMLFSPCSSELGDIYYNYPSVKETSGADEEVVSTVNMNDVLVNANSNESHRSILSNHDSTRYVYDTPEDSNNSTAVSGATCRTSPKNLKLELDAKLLETPSTLTTPEVINVITDYENKFNILDIVSEEDIRTVSDQFQQNDSTPSNDNIFNFITQSVATKNFNKISSSSSNNGNSARKRRLADEDDEDYIPSAQIKKVGRKSIKILKKKYDSDSSDDSDEDEETIVKRGRPSKRRVSFESDNSRDVDAQRYRELRDKNNEASRRSRLKRKMKEMSLEKEADVLEGKNIKLKAQVEQLESLVKNFRTNLFAIMLSK